MATIDQEKLRQYLWDHIVPHLVQREECGSAWQLGLGMGVSPPPHLKLLTLVQLVIRRSPDVRNRMKHSHDVMEREFHSLKALEGSEVPVPKVFHMCESGAILGTPWFCCEFVEGVVYHQPTLKEIPSYMRRGVYKSAVAALASTHKEDWRKRGLNVVSGSSKDTPYYERQLRTLIRVLKRQEALTGRLKGIDEVLKGLGRVLKSGRVPPGLTLIHGDFSLDNIIFKHSPRNEVSGIIDWELSTIGHPMADVCTLLGPFYLPSSKGPYSGLKDMDLSSNGLPSVQEILDIYHDASGCDESYLKEGNLNFFYGICILQGVASSSHASEVVKLPDLFVHLALMELQKLQTRISEEGSISSSLLKPHFRAVVMDVGGVLCASPLAAIAKHERIYGFQPGVITKALASSSITRQLFRGELVLNRGVLNEWSEEMTKYITSPCSSSSTVYSDDSERSSHSFICLHSDDLIRDIAMCIYSPIPEMLSCVSTLLLMGIKVAILSNDFHIGLQLANELGINVLDKENNVYGQLKRLGVKEQDALRSSQIKICKPDPNAYLTACSAIGVLPTESIMCDDLRENLVTATNLGMGTVLFDINKDKRKAIGELMSLLNGHHREQEACAIITKRRDDVLMPVVQVKGETGETSTRLFVSNLPPSCTSAQLKKHFSSKPAAGFLLTDAQVIHKQGSGPSSRCIGFVGFSNSKGASAARKYFNGSYLGAGRLNITFARDSEQRRPSSSPSSAPPPIPDVNVKSTKLNRRSQMLKSDLEAALAPRSTHAWSNDDEVKAVNQSAKKKSKNRTTGFTSPDDGEAMKCTAKQKKKPKMAMLLESDDGDLQWLREKSLSSHRSQQQMDDEVSGMGEVSQSEHDDEVGKGICDITNSVEEKKKKSGVEVYSEARLYLKNIPFSCGHDNLKDILSPYGRVTDLHIPKNDRDEDGGGDNRGYAFAQFSSPVEACAAAESLNGFTFQGRVLHIVPARGSLKSALPLLESSVSTVRGKAGRLKRMGRTEQAGEEAWMSSHVRGEAAATAVARKLGVGRADLLGIKNEVTGKKGDSTAVRQALVETDIITENERYFAENGVDISVALGDSVAGDKAAVRSDQVIIVKNLLPSVSLEDLMKLFGIYGDVTRLLLPPSRSMALVEFSVAKDASKAFKKLAYRRVAHVPLYLEWARQGAMLACEGEVEGSSAQEGTLKKGTGHRGAKEAELSTGVEEEEGDLIDEENDIAKNPTTLFVKGLSFSTTEAALRKRCEELLNINGNSSVRMVSIPRHPVKLGAKPASSEGRSAGYGFVEFRTPKMAALACQALNGVIFDGHSLQVKPTQKRLVSVPSNTPSGDLHTAKIIVRNVPFQASPKEVKELFEAHGAVKTLRMPKMRVAGMGMQHRGFAFVELLSVGEAKRAMKALSGTHLYGRHLVLEWAEEDNSVQGLREKAQRDIASSPTTNAIPKRLRG